MGNCHSDTERSEVEESVLTHKVRILQSSAEADSFKNDMLDNLTIGGPVGILCRIFIRR